METRRGVVVRVHGGHYYVLEGDRQVDCSIRGRMKKERRDTKLVAIGDVVIWTPAEEDTGIIEEVLPRHSVLSRTLPPPRPFRDSGRSPHRWTPPETETEQVIMANPDQVLLVFAVANPPPNPLMLDRYLVACEAAQLPVLMIANKVDLGIDEDVAEMLDMYRQIGYTILETSAEMGVGLATLHEALRGRLSVLTGPSGAGKSTLLNALWPHLDLNTGEISTYHDRGRHTTVVAELLTPEPDVFVADTPGLRQFRLWDIDPEQLEAFFPEMLPYLHECRFAPCTHTHEPDCAVREAAERGEIHPLRYESYLRMFEYGF